MNDAPNGTNAQAETSLQKGSRIDRSWWLTLVWCLPTLWFCTIPNEPLLGSCFLFLTGVIVICYWLCCSHLVIEATEKQVRRYLVSGIALALTIILSVTDIGLMIRIRLCEPWLRASVQDVQEGNREKFDDSWAGGFPVEGAYIREGDCVYFITGANWKTQPLAIGYVPPGTATPEHWEHLYGPWHRANFAYGQTKAAPKAIELKETQEPAKAQK